MREPPPELTDAALAVEFVDRFGKDIRYVEDRGVWLVFEDNRWRASGDGGAMRMASAYSAEILAKASLVQVSDRSTQAERDRLVEHSSAFARVSRIRAMLELAKVDRRILVHSSFVDSDPWLVGAPNCVIDLHDGSLKPHARDKLITRVLGCEADLFAACPRWVAFLEEVVPDAEVRRYLHKACGYSLTGLDVEQHLIFLHGDGANGKSTFLETIFNVMGGYAKKAAESLVCVGDRNATPGHVIAELCGIRFLISSEIRQGAHLNEAAIKAFTGGDTMRGEEKYKSGFDFRGYAKLWMAGNDRPIITGTDHGIWRRVRLIDFPVVFPEERQDRFLRQKLSAEMPGILNWLIEGCALWREEGLIAPLSVKSAVEEYRADQDVVSAFISGMTLENPGGELKHSDLFAAFSSWSRIQNRKSNITSKMLAKRLRQIGWMSSKKAGSMTWIGRAVQDERRN